MFFSFVFVSGNIVRQCQPHATYYDALLHVQCECSVTDQWQINRQDGDNLTVIDETKGFRDSMMAFRTFLRHAYRA